MTIKDHKPPIHGNGKPFINGFTPNFTDYKSWGVIMKDHKDVKIIIYQHKNIQRRKPEQVSGPMLGIKELETREVSPVMLKIAEKTRRK